MKIEYLLDIDKLKTLINEASNLNDNNDFFKKLSEINQAKSELKDILEEVDSIEQEIKSVINGRAKQLYGSDWQVIKGRGYKLSRYFSGDIFSRLEDQKIDKKYLKIIERLDSKIIEETIVKTGALPKGLEYNNNRSEVIRISVDKNENNQNQS